MIGNERELRGNEKEVRGGTKKGSGATCETYPQSQKSYRHTTRSV